MEATPQTVCSFRKGLRNPFASLQPGLLVAINYGYPWSPASFAPFEMGSKFSHPGKLPGDKVERAATIDGEKVFPRLSSSDPTN